MPEVTMPGSINGAPTHIPKFSREDASFRRLALIEATAHCLARDGSEASVRSICREAGVSAGLLRHYFDGKEDLIAQTYQHYVDIFSGITHATLADKTIEPEQKIRQFFDISFSSDFIDASVLSVWIAFWRLIRTDKTINHVHKRSFRSYREDLAKALEDLAGIHNFKINPDKAALSLTSMLDGLWLEISLDPSAFKPQQAIEICNNWLDGFIAIKPVGRFT